MLGRRRLESRPAKRNDVPTGWALETWVNQQIAGLSLTADQHQGCGQGHECKVQGPEFYFLVWVPREQTVAWYEIDALFHRRMGF